MYNISKEVQNLVDNYITEVLCNTTLSRRVVLCSDTADLKDERISARRNRLSEVSSQQEHFGATLF